MEHAENLTYNFMPHGHCYLWMPELVTTQVITNSIIAVAYFLIPFALAYFVNRRKDLVFQWIFILFSIFIVSCGVTHIMDIVTIWYPYYWLDSFIRGITALASILTAISLVPLIPKAIALPSPKQLQKEISERKNAEEQLLKIRDELEIMVNERTTELTEANKMLKQEIINRKNVETILLQKTTELEESNQELQNFAYIISHDLQEPLRMISSYIQLFSQKYQGNMDEEADLFINFAVEGVKRMKSMIQGLLVYSRFETKKIAFSNVDFNKIIENVMNNLKVFIDENDARIIFNNLPGTKADMEQMVNLFQNLISNAIKYRKKDINPIIEISAEQKENEILFSVKDNGIGIDGKYFEMIFVIFKRLHSKDFYPGDGLGLSVCKKIVERHGGKIWLESEPGQGTTFYFNLPLIKHDTEKLTPGRSVML